MALIAKGVDYLIEKGYQNMLLWVFEQNSAKQFYQKLQPSLPSPASLSWLVRT